MIARFIRLAEQAAAADVSRRGFLGWIGRGAAAAASAVGALFISTRLTRAGGGPPECFSSDDCQKFEYCAKELGDCDGIGCCTPKPDICPEDYDPVCGCDGQTYVNSCFAAISGVALAYLGECQ
jgi:hypothetical protein